LRPAHARVEFGIDNLALDRTMAGALIGRRAMARDAVPS